MPFGNYKTLAEALRALQITETRTAFLEPKSVAVSDYFRSELERTLREFDVTCSEAAICESLLFPLLREAIKPYTGVVLGLWSHVGLYRGSELLGIPDYVVAERSPLSRRVMETPCAVVMLAWKNDFDAGWGECLAAMHAIQELNGEPARNVYGAVSDGFTWRFGQLRKRILANDPMIYDLSRLDILYAALSHFFELCQDQILYPTSAA